MNLIEHHSAPDRCNRYIFSDAALIRKLSGDVDSKGDGAPSELQKPAYGRKEAQMEIDESALEAATKHIYEDKGDRKGVLYVGWEHEPEEVKDQWRADVRVTVAAYLQALQ